METLPVWLTVENVVIFLAALEALLGAIPNNWIKYRSFLLRAIKAVVNFVEES